MENIITSATENYMIIEAEEGYAVSNLPVIDDMINYQSFKKAFAPLTTDMCQYKAVTDAEDAEHIEERRRRIEEESEKRISELKRD